MTTLQLLFIIYLNSAVICFFTTASYNLGLRDGQGLNNMPLKKVKDLEESTKLARWAALIPLINTALGIFYAFSIVKSLTR